MAPNDEREIKGGFCLADLDIRTIYRVVSGIAEALYASLNRAHAGHLQTRRPACGYFAVVRCARPIWHAILDPSKLGSFSSAGRPRPALRGVVAPVATSGEGMRRAFRFLAFQVIVL